MGIIKTYWWRHGQTDWNKQGRWQGHTDIPLNETGINQARLLATRMTQIPLEGILTSDLMRARQTAQIVAKEKNIPLSATKDIREGHYGRAEGSTIEEMRRKYGIKMMEQWKSSSPETLDIRIPGGESKREIIRRVLGAVESWLKVQGGDCYGISTHGGVLRKVFQKIDAGVTLPSPVPNGQAFCLLFNPEKSEWIYQKDILSS